MLRDEEIVYIANDWFGENKTSAHHVAEVLCRHNTVLYVEAAGMRNPRAAKRDLHKIFRKVSKLFAKPVPAGERFYLYSPFVLPFHRFALVRRLNKLLVNFMLRRACRSVGFTNPLLWIFMPHYASAIDSIRNKGVIYYCVDEYSAQPKVDVEMIRTMEAQILRRADVVFTVSEELRQRKAGANPHTYLSRHGVDVDLFARALSPDTTIPEDAVAISSPVAGFFGLIEEWIDLNLIDHLATKLPEVSFVFIGRIAQDVSALARHTNIHILGARPYSTLPHYLKKFDVCLLPYKMDDEQVRNSNPKKLREYLAGGKPIVSVPLREVEEYDRFVSIAATYDEFVDAVKAAIADDSQQERLARANSVRDESWEGKVERLSTIIGQHIAAITT